MPKLSADEIKSLVAKKEVAAITLDTSVFDQYDCNLRYKALTALTQFKQTGVKVLFSEVTLSEVRAHIVRDARESAQKLKAAINGFDKGWRLDLDKAAVEAQLGVGNDPAERADQLIASFLDEVAGVRLELGDSVSVRDLVDLYFKAEAPFSPKDGKKSEFPDAIALLSLESWAGANGKILAISRDDDWRRYAETSPNIICVEDMAEGLGAFHDPVAAARIIGSLRDGGAPSLRRQIESALERFFEDFEIEAYASHHFDEEPGGAVVETWEVAPGDVNVVAADDDTFTVLAEIDATVEFQAYFSFSHWDGIDRDYVRLGGGSATRSREVSLQIALTFYKDDADAENPEPHDVEVESRRLVIDFGEVEPDWG